MATVRSSSLSRAFHTLPKPPTPSRSISSKRPSFVSDGAIRVALLWSTRLKWLPQRLQVRSVSARIDGHFHRRVAAWAADFEAAGAGVGMLVL